MKQCRCASDSMVSTSCIRLKISTHSKSFKTMCSTALCTNHVPVLGSRNILVSDLSAHAPQHTTTSQFRQCCGLTSPTLTGTSEQKRKSYLGLLDEVVTHGLSASLLSCGLRLQASRAPAISHGCCGHLVHLENC